MRLLRVRGFKKKALYGMVPNGGTTVRQVVSSCPTCQLNNPQGTHRPQLAQPIQQCGTYPGEDWQMDFIQMPVSQGYKYLLVMIDTFTGWIRLSHPD